MSPPTKPKESLSYKHKQCSHTQNFTGIYIYIFTPPELPRFFNIFWYGEASTLWAHDPRDSLENNELETTSFKN